MLFLADQCLRVVLVRVTSQFLRIVLFLPELLGIMIALRSCETSWSRFYPCAGIDRVPAPSLRVVITTAPDQDRLVLPPQPPTSAPTQATLKPRRTPSQ